MTANPASSPRKTPKPWMWLAGAVIAAGVVGYVATMTGNPLRVQLLDVSGYRDPMPIWMVFRLNLGLTNDGRDPLTIRSVHVEPDVAGFNEAYNVETPELTPPLVIEPGHSVTYQAATTLLNANQLPAGRRELLLRVRVEQNGEERIYEFPAEIDYTPQPAQRNVRF